MMPSDKALVWITGAAGLIGHYLVQLAPRFAPDIAIQRLTRSELNLTDSNALKKAFSEQKPSLVIHCAAMSKSPACEANPKLAWQINVDATENLAELASKVPFLFFSSDLVFDGRKGNYIETDEPSPLSVYAETKSAAEKIVLQNPKHTVIRTSLNFGKSETGDRSFNEEMCNAWRSGKAVKLFVDEFRCPIPAEVTARAVWELAQKNVSGLLHLAGAERLSRFEIGRSIAEQVPELNPQVQGSTLREYEGAPRPPDTSLNCEKVEKLLSFPLPKFSDWIRESRVI